MKKFLLGVYHPSIILTFCSVFAAILGISALFVPNAPFSNEPVKASMCLLIIAGVCDMFDGVVARAFKNRTDFEKEYGIQLDSLADVVAFVLFPICILLKLSKYSAVGIIISLFVAFCGITRLCWFNATTSENPHFFTGMPVTFTAILLPLTYVVTRLLSNLIDIQIQAFSVMLALIAILFVANFKMKKPGIKLRIIIGIVAIAAFVLVLVL